MKAIALAAPVVNGPAAIVEVAPVVVVCWSRANEPPLFATQYALNFLF